MPTDEGERTRAAWDDIAAGFDRFVTPMSMSLAEDALRRVGLGSGMRFLDVATGSGALAIPAARHGAHVVATDISPTMIERLDRRALDEGLTNLEGRVMDGYALAFEDGVFDVSGSQNGVSVFPHLERGLREMVRVTKPGGRALLIAFGAPTKAEFLGFFVRALQAAVPGHGGLGMDPPPPPFQVADPEVLRQRMVDAGLTDVRVDVLTWPMEIRSAAHLLDVVANSNPIGAMLVGSLTQAQHVAARQALDQMLGPRARGHADAVLTSEINIGIGTKA